MKSLLRSSNAWDQVRTKSYRHRHPACGCSVSCEYFEVQPKVSERTFYIMYSKVSRRLRRTTSTTSRYPSDSKFPHNSLLFVLSNPITPRKTAIILRTNCTSESAHKRYLSDTPRMSSFILSRAHLIVPTSKVRFERSAIRDGIRKWNSTCLRKHSKIRYHVVHVCARITAYSYVLHLKIFECFVRYA